MKTKWIMTAAVAALISIGTTAKAVSFHYSSTIGSPSAFINFDGAGSFSFSADGAGNMFQISDGTASGLFGTMTGNYSIGAITTVSGTSSATVTGNGTLTILDGATPLTATLSWINIVQSGTSSALNLNGNVNLTGITYSGANADLLALANASGGNGSDTLNFTFSPSVPLADLKSIAQHTTFSGSISNVPDGGTTMMLLGGALTGLGLLRKKLVA